MHSNRHSNRPILNQLPNFLVTTSQKGIRCTSHSQTLLGGNLIQFPCLVHRDRQRLLIVNMFSMLKGTQRHWTMSSRNSDVQNQFNITPLNH